ncbi:MAG TPA: hypothetical protein PKI66_04860 [Methanobacteriaceae archaeon]|nr:hypothetical protein [Methanobacteriaceae archaeon]
MTPCKECGRPLPLHNDVISHDGDTGTTTYTKICTLCGYHNETHVTPAGGLG